ncbi:MAG: hypothetical protein KDD50_03360 [Bdellovibrionales bacterium]|nr:hypothetical protein [Bdellovibrionales bacterium]
MKKLVAGIAIVIFSAQSAGAKTSIKQSLDQLEKNKQNSAQNLKQYEDNLGIVDQNVSEVKKAIKGLQDQRTQLQKNVNNVEKNKAAIEEMRKKVLEHKMAEAQKLEEDLKDIARLEKLLQKLRSNQEKREDNLKAYNLKLDEIVKEKSAWDNQKASMNDLNKSISEKLTYAEAELKKWESKQKSYQKEVSKWKTETADAERVHRKFQDLQ